MPQTHDRQADGYRIATKATWIGMLVNAGLGAFKIIAGVLGSSWAVVADGIESLCDILGSAGAMVGLIVARRAPDADHPYGHGKAEVLAARFVASLLLVVGVLILMQAGHLLFVRHDIQAPTAIALVGALASIVVKEALYQYKAHLWRKTKSSVLLAEAWHHRSDALSSIPVLIGVAGAMIFGEKMRWLDPAAEAVVGVIIVWIALKMFYTTLGELMDKAAPADVTERVRALARDVPRVKDVEKVVCRKAGLNYLVDIHIEVEPKMPVDEGHAVAQAVRDRLVNAGENILQVLVHVEPYYPNDH
jgi:cation diffusion facilitator family transporter